MTSGLLALPLIGGIGVFTGAALRYELEVPWVVVGFLTVPAMIFGTALAYALMIVVGLSFVQSIVALAAGLFLTTLSYEAISG